jgi:ribosomal protein L11 methylase PrmA
VVPSWAQPPAAGGAVSLIMEPGLAFGTGEHPTTRLCLRWLWRRRKQLQVGTDVKLYAQQSVLSAKPVQLVQRVQRGSTCWIDVCQPQSLTAHTWSSHLNQLLALQGRSVMDYGAGSGVLAVAALKLGADSAAATDVDACAVSACRRNAQLNGVDGSLAALRCERDMQVGDALYVGAAVLPFDQHVLPAAMQPGGQDAAAAQTAACSSIIKADSVPVHAARRP